MTNDLYPSSVRMTIMRGDGIMQGVPAAVVRFQGVLQARTRFVILRHLLDRPRTFPELRELELHMSIAALREGINDLAAAGYVSDDAPAGARRKPTRTLFTVNREQVMSDLSETVRFLTI